MEAKVLALTKKAESDRTKEDTANLSCAKKQLKALEKPKGDSKTGAGLRRCFPCFAIIMTWIKRFGEISDIHTTKKDICRAVKELEGAAKKKSSFVEVSSTGDDSEGEK